ncbi:ABC transporter substrate-binding protein [Thermomicrobium sp. CFH 73360]|uniref:ABC transporter substrate-binding protein n=1 Tax=Thermomicrobium sp. CFH 73360 TaxID=2951987 RepID=UPI002077162A|nr:ABC transporter substrate-binding protein [Thermomicrobium sp. CFH 73360]MCM8745842.1 ABC transporter substrate-binding protein [Thermomicrobium sp. CFH 73360]
MADRIDALLRFLFHQQRLRRRELLVGIAAAGAMAACRQAATPTPAPVAFGTPTPSGAGATPPATAADTLLVPGYDDPNRWKGRTLVVTSWGGALQDALRKAIYEPFSRLTGCQIVEDTTDEAKLRTMVESGRVEWDVVDVGTEAVIPMGRLNLLEPLDYSKIDTKDIFPELVLEHGIGYYYYSTCLAYRKDKFPQKPPNSWADFWDVQGFPGVRAFQKYAQWGPIEAALLADGVPIDQLYPLDIDRAFRSLDRIKPHVRVWWEAGAQPAQLLSDGEVDLTDAWIARIQFLIEQGSTVLGYTWNQGRLSSDSLVIPRGSKNVDVAHDFINFALRPEIQRGFAMIYPDGPANKRAFEALPPERVAVLPSAPQNKALQVYPDYQWWAEHLDAVVERWNAWVAA